MPRVRELHVQCSVAFDTSRLGVVFPGLFGSSSSGNFQFGFWL